MKWDIKSTSPILGRHLCGSDKIAKATWGCRVWIVSKGSQEETHTSWGCPCVKTHPHRNKHNSRQETSLKPAEDMAPMQAPSVLAGKAFSFSLLLRPEGVGQSEDFSPLGVSSFRGPTGTPQVDTPQVDGFPFGFPF